MTRIPSPPNSRHGRDRSRGPGFLCDEILAARLGRAANLMMLTPSTGRSLQSQTLLRLKLVGQGAVPSAPRENSPAWNGTSPQIRPRLTAILALADPALTKPARVDRGRRSITPDIEIAHLNSAGLRSCARGWLALQCEFMRCRSPGRAFACR